MPTYVYSCDACGKQFEQFQSFKEEPLQTCICGESGEVRRVFQPVGIVFKGSGWYVNDSRGTKSATSGTAPSEAKGDSTSEPSSDSKSEPSSDSKSEPSSDSKSKPSSDSKKSEPTSPKPADA